MLSFGAGSLKRKEENVRPVDFSVLSLLNCMVELGRVPSHIKRIVSGLSAINQIRCCTNWLRCWEPPISREGRCGKVWWEYKQAWTEEVDERPPGCVVILNPEKRAHILRKARHAKVPIIALVDPVFQSDPKLHRDKRINHPIPVEGTEQLSGLISDLIYPKTLFLLYFLKHLHMPLKAGILVLKRGLKVPFPVVRFAFVRLSLVPKKEWAFSKSNLLFTHCGKTKLTYFPSR
jgi:hypothetical protein